MSIGRLIRSSPLGKTNVKQTFSGAGEVPLIALYVHDLSGGGVERVKLRLAAELSRMGFRVDLVVNIRRGALSDLVSAAYRIVELDAPRTRNSFQPLSRYLKDEKPSVIISSMGAQNVVTILARIWTLSKTRVYLSQHNALREEAQGRVSLSYRLMPFLYRIFLGMADGVICVSAGLARELEHYTGRRNKIHVIYNPAFPEPVGAGGAAVRKLIEVTAGFPYILAAGRLVPQKDFKTLLLAYSKIDLSITSHLVICGEGTEMASLGDLSKQLGITDRVHFIGFRNDLLEIMADAKLFVLSSRYEGFANVLIEALASRVPVVSTACNYGPAEILEGGKFGRLVPVGDADALAKAITECLSEPADPEPGFARAAEFNVHRIATRYVDILFSRATPQEKAFVTSLYEKKVDWPAPQP